MNELKKMIKKVCLHTGQVRYVIIFLYVQF